MKRTKSAVAKSATVASPAMRSIVYHDVDTLQSAPRNAKKHDVATIQRSVGRFGFVDPIVLDERTSRIVSGHGRVETLRAMRAKHDLIPEGVTVDGTKWMVPVYRGWSSQNDREAEAYTIAANRLTERGGWDEQNLAAMLGDLDADKLLDGIGYDVDDVARMLSCDIALADDGMTKSSSLVETFQVLVECSTEEEQGKLLQRLTEEGLKCRSLIS